MDKSKLILIIPALVVFVLIVIHSVRVNGPVITRKFFFWCFLFCYAKEFINANSRAPEYFAKGLELLGVPMMVPFGWVISIYLSWFLAEMLLCPHGRNPKKMLPTIALSSIIIAAISFMVECTGGNMRWWWWNYDIPGLWYENAALKMPVKIIGGWGTTCLIFFSFFAMGVISPFRKARHKTLKIIGVFAAIAFPLGVLATNLVLRGLIVGPLVTMVIFCFLLLPKLRDQQDARKGSRKVLRGIAKMRGRGSLQSANKPNK